MKILTRISFVASLVLAFHSHAQQVTLPLWPHATPEPAQTTEPERDLTTSENYLMNGRRTARFTNVTVPTLSVYQPRVRPTGAAALVFPGGGYTMLAWNGEGTDTCDWLNSLGMTCLLVKYRVPEAGHYPENFADLEDAQQAMRLARAHAATWHIDPARIGVVGFSAGGHLAVVLSTHWDDTHIASTPASGDSDTRVDARPAFAILGYPAYLYQEADRTMLDPALTPPPHTPPTFLVQAENDSKYIDSSLVYYRALKDAKVPAEMHLFATGGHGFGMYPTGKPEENWTQLAATWLRSIGMLPPLPPRPRDNGAPANLSATPTVAPCSTMSTNGSMSQNPRPTPAGDNSNQLEQPCPEAGTQYPGR